MYSGDGARRRSAPDLVDFLLVEADTKRETAGLDGRRIAVDGEAFAQNAAWRLEQYTERLLAARG